MSRKRSGSSAAIEPEGRRRPCDDSRRRGRRSGRARRVAGPGPVAAASGSCSSSVRSGRKLAAAEGVHARGPLRSRGRRRRPDRRSSCRRSGRTAPRARARAPAGSSARHDRRGRRRTAGPRPPAPSGIVARSSSSRIASAPGLPPGSRVSTTSRPRSRSAAASAFAWVDLPTPSPPSSAMNLPRAVTPAERALQPGQMRPKKPASPTSSPATSGTSAAACRRW